MVPILSSRQQTRSVHQTRSAHEWERKGSTVTPPDSRENPAYGIAPGRDEQSGHKSFAEFDLENRVCIVTGAARGLGLALAEGLVEAGATGMCNVEAPNTCLLQVLVRNPFIGLLYT